MFSSSTDAVVTLDAAVAAAASEHDATSAVTTVYIVYMHCCHKMKITNIFHINIAEMRGAWRMATLVSCRYSYAKRLSTTKSEIKDCD